MPDQSSAGEEYAILQGIKAPPRRIAADDPVVMPGEVDFPVTLRGYDRVAVDAYVQRVRELVAELEASRSRDAAVHRALERVGEQISGILQRARDTAEQITAQSRKEAEDRLQVAGQEAAQMVGAAAQRAEDLDAEAERIAAERRRLIDDARELAGQVIGLTAAANQRFPPDEPQASTPSAPADPAAAAAPEAPAPDLGAESQLAELWAQAAGKPPNDDPTGVLPPDQSGFERSTAAQERPGDLDESDEPNRPR